uniref:S-adenosyl-L-methionine-dependent tRNA 4-demethylwyosine synthase TYW1 n=1 Tax=Salarias fasciatus TaxID=181472 RepID=A0A672IHP5_SALFA
MVLKKQNLSSEDVSFISKVERNSHQPHKEIEVHVSGVKIFYGSQTGTAKGFAQQLCQEVKALGLPAEVIDMKDYDPDDQLADECVSKTVCVFLVATYTDGRPTENAEWFCKWLEEASTDFRYGKTYLEGLRYAVFGLGDSVYVGHYNTVRIRVSRHRSVINLSELHGERLVNRFTSIPPGGEECGQVAVDAQRRAHHDQRRGRLQRGEEPQRQRPGGLPLLEGQVPQPSAGSGERREEELQRELQDWRLLQEQEERRGSSSDEDESGLQERNNYSTLIGSHSGVKLCRWTKSMLRGRGGCYKHTFYGIESHRCMETTPSLACANKCVFCWRHHTNPVGTEWRWKMDPAHKILEDAVEKHQGMIRQFRGVPGVKPERYEEGLAVKHCALSLVGEPIMYPEINAFIRLLHQQHISSFLVTNAQFPEEIRSLVPVTQLYVSVDASTKDSLKKIDRPLFKDFWPRFLASLRALGEKRQRTVYRLTLVKAWNVEEMLAYSELIALGQPDFIEVKGVTYCGESSASTLTMANVPWHQEVVAFVQQLADMLPQYEIACEHEHSNCLLIAHTKFKVEGEWWTWIDYQRFQELVEAHEESGGQRSFSASDYMAKTPSWALFGAREQGFDPADTRFQRRNKTKDISGC